MARFICTSALAASLLVIPVAHTAAAPGDPSTGLATASPGSRSPRTIALSTPHNAGASFVWRGAGAAAYTEPGVTCAAAPVGTLDFLSRPFLNDVSGSATGGAALEGGFAATAPGACGGTGTSYAFLQVVQTDTPAAGRGPGMYVDSTAPRRDPFFTSFSDDLTNPVGDLFTVSYYDAPQRAMSTLTNWRGELMLVCRDASRQTITVLGSLTWGLDIVQVGFPPITVASQYGPTPWGDASDAALQAAAAEMQGTSTERGWTIDRGCCCELPTFSSTSATNGTTSLVMTVATGNAPIDRVVVFPRTRTLTTFSPAPPSPFTVGAWGGSIAPARAYETTGATMLQAGIDFASPGAVASPAVYTFNLPLSGHESFFDIFLHDPSNDRWRAATARTQQLLGDMDGNLAVTFGDLSVFDLAVSNPASYASQYPGLDPLLAGDMNHDGHLDGVDRAILASIVSTAEATDIVPVAQPAGLTEGIRIY